MNEIGCYNLINRPTIITKDKVSIIDNIFYNNDLANVNSGIIISDISDHFPIFTIISNKVKKHEKLIYKLINNTSESNLNLLCNFLSEVNWNFIECDDMEISWNLFQKFCSR